MTTIGDKFSALGTSIINLVGTRADKNLSNLSATGQQVIADLAGIPQSAVGAACTKATSPASSGTVANSTFTVTGSFEGLSPTSKAATGAPINTKITANSVSALVTVPANAGYKADGTTALSNPAKFTMFINSSKQVIARRYVASYSAPAHPSSDLMWYDLDSNYLKTYSSSWSTYAGFAIGEFKISGTTVSDVKFYKSIQILDAPTVSSSMLSCNVPVGTVISYMGTDVPEGFLLMDGRYLSKTAYANLYSVIGDTQTTTAKEGYFQIADMTDGRYLMGSTVAGSSSATLPVRGNGKCLGLTDGTNSMALAGTANVGLSYHQTPYNKNVGTAYTVAVSKYFTTGVGVVSNSASGLVATLSGVVLGTIPSEKLGGFYIRY